MREIFFDVPGPPVAWHRTGGKGTRRFKNKQDRDFQQLIARTAQAARGRQPWSIDGEFLLDIESRVPDRRRRDVDNLAKNAMDGLIQILYRDDSLVSDLHIRRIVSKESVGTSVRLARIL